MNDDVIVMISQYVEGDETFVSFTLDTKITTVCGKKGVFKMCDALLDEVAELRHLYRHLVEEED